MRNLVKPIWGLIFLVIPIICFYYWQAPIIFDSNILPNLENLYQLQVIFIFSFALLLVGASFSIFFITRKQNLSNAYAFITAALIAPIIWLTLNLGFIFNEGNEINSLHNTLRAFVVTISSINLLHCVYIVALNSINEEQTSKSDLKPSLGMLLFVIWLIIIQLSKFFFEPENEIRGVDLLISFGVLIVAFLLFTLLKWSLKESEYIVNSASSMDLIKRVLLAGVLPLMGLFLNNSILGGGLDGENGIFGNFNNYWFYLIPIVNTVILCLPTNQNLNFTLFAYFAKSITLAYVVYFVIIFIPVLPIGIIGIIVLGAGLLTFVPYLLLALQINLMQKDYQQLLRNFSHLKLWLIFIAGFLVIPLFITLNYINQRKTLNEAFEYVFHPDYKINYKINSKPLKRILDNLNGHQRSNRGFMSIDESGIPIISSWYNYLVLDYKNIDDETTGLLRKVLLDEEYTPWQQEREKDKEVILQNFKTESKYDPETKQWQTWLHLDLKNQHKDFGIREFISKIKVPENCLINNYYLYVGKEKKYGMHTERNSAIELYKNITQSPRDPGLVYYHSPTEVMLKVFPFQKDELRRTGISFIHREAVNIEMEGIEITLGIPNSEDQIILSNSDNQVPLIHGVEKINLPVAQRKPYFHFLVDASAHAKEKHASIISSVEELCKQYPNLAKNAEITFVGGNIITQKKEENWQKNYQKQDFSGSYFVDRAIKQTLVKSYLQSENRYPILVMVSNHFSRAILSNHYADYDFCFPESANLYSLKPGKQLSLHSLLDKTPEIKQKDCPINFQETTLVSIGKEGKKQFLARNLSPSLLISDTEHNFNLEDIKPNNWADGMLLKAKLRAEVLYPNKAQKNWLTNLKLSFKNQTLTSQTAFMVVETKEQEEMMAKKHDEILSGKADYSHSKDTMSMPEPGFWAFAILLIGILSWRIRCITLTQSAQI